jgi:glutamate N-acetyltransferase/amino-acid N-acetyltransferase
MKRKGLRSSRMLIPGYRFAGVHARIKGNKRKDLGLIVSDRPAKAVACFTTNRLKAAPVVQGQKVLRDGRLQAVVVNSGNANVATGAQGLKHAFATAANAARVLGISPHQVLVSSTGKIGVRLEIKKILQALPSAAHALSERGVMDFAQAILTTDKFVKIHQVKAKFRGKSFTLLGIAKGAGMIAPDMATMLAYILTDLDVALPVMKKIFPFIVSQTFNCVSVDGDMSTNDTALLMANGASGISLKSLRSPGMKQFAAGLHEVCRALALKMVEDGEGATKVVKIHVRGAKSQKSARGIADAVARSPLVKTSFFGEDPNWGRVFAAVGYSGETFDPSRVDIRYGSVSLVRRGVFTSHEQEAKAHKVMKKRNFTVTVDLHQGSGSAEVWTSDLTYEYVKINAEYRT